MDDCIFCKIIKGEIPSYKVYEDDLFFGFLDIKPLNPGNCLLIPKKHFRWVSDVPEFGQYFEVAKKIGLSAQKVVNADYITFYTLGMEVPHAHIRIIPRFYNDAHSQGVDLSQIQTFSPEEMKRVSQEISSNIK